MNKNLENIFMLIDFQKDFVEKDGKLTCDNAPLIARVRDFVGQIKQGMFDEAVFTIDTHFAESYKHTNEAKDFPPHCIYGTDGCAIAVPLDNIEQQGIDIININKNTTNLWGELHQYAYLAEKDWSKAVVYLSGVLTEICVKQAMDGLLNRGAKVVLMDDLIGGLKIGAKELSAQPEYAEYVKSGKLSLTTSAAFLSQFQKQRMNV